MKTALKYRNSRGFSMIEILVAIGILVILIGIVAFTVSNVTGGAKKNETKVRLEALNAMLTELNTTAKFTKQPARMYYDSPVSVWDASTNGPFDIWKDANPSDNSVTPPNPVPLGKPLPSPGNVTIDLFMAEATNAAKPAARIRSAAVLNTQLVMGLLLSVPRNASTLANLPPKSFMDNPNSNGAFSAANMGAILVNEPASPNGTAKKTPFKPSVLVDGWGNPIIFVPASGLHDVTFKEHGPTEKHIITSTGKLIEEGDVGGPPNFATYVPPGNAQPFFASAGPDGDFSTGDDNVYSFDN